MRNCHITLTEWGFEANVNNHDTIDKIFLRLPLSHQREFQKTASLFAAGKEPDFKVLMEFVQTQAMLSNTRFSQMLHIRKDSDFTYTSGRRTQTFNAKFVSKDTPIKAYHGRRQVHAIEVSQRGTATYKCVMCNDPHPLWK